MAVVPLALIDIYRHTCMLACDISYFSTSASNNVIIPVQIKSCYFVIIIMLVDPHSRIAAWLQHYLYNYVYLAGCFTTCSMYYMYTLWQLIHKQYVHLYIYCARTTRASSHTSQHTPLLLTFSCSASMQLLVAYNIFPCSLPL